MRDWLAGVDTYADRVRCTQWALGLYIKPIHNIGRTTQVKVRFAYQLYHVLTAWWRAIIVCLVSPSWCRPNGDDVVDGRDWWKVTAPLINNYRTKDGAWIIVLGIPIGSLIKIINSLGVKYVKTV